MPKAISTTTKSSLYNFGNVNFGTPTKQQTVYEQFEKLQILEEIDTKKIVIAYAVTFGPLAICFLGCLFPYLSAFRRNLHAHGGSPLLPMITHTYRTIKFNYTMFFVFGILTGVFATIPNGFAVVNFSLRMFLIFAWAVTLYVSMYQLAISILSIHRFINSRQPEELRGNLTRKNVIVLMVVIFLVVILKDVAWVAYFIAALISGKSEMIDTVLMYYSMIYVTYQILLFIGMVFQFSISEQPKSHSEYCIVTHTKYIGLTKLILGVTCFVCYILRIETMLASMLFFSIDIFLVPVVVQLTEIRANPNVIIPTEMKKVAMSA